MKLITEQVEEVRYLVEAAGDKRSSYIEGIFMQSEKKNRNGRVYTKKVLEPAITKYVTEQVNTGRAVGELNHPESPSVNLDKVSHRITSLSWDGNNVVGKALILDTPMGLIVKGLMEGGVKLGVSSRGMGSIEQKAGVSYIKPGFILSTVDIVQDPSAPEAFVNGIMEGVEYFYENGILKAQEIEQYETEIRKAKNATAVGNSQMKLFKNFLSNL